MAVEMMAVILFLVFLCHSLFTLTVLPSYSNTHQALEVKLPEYTVRT